MKPAPVVFAITRAQAAVLIELAQRGPIHWPVNDRAAHRTWLGLKRRGLVELPARAANGWHLTTLGAAAARVASLIQSPELP